MYSSEHAYSLCVAACQSVQAQCVRTVYCVSPWLQSECGVVAKDTGTQSPAGEGDEAQLGIIKPSTVSVKGPGCQAGLVSPRRSSLGLTTLKSPFAVFPDQWERRKSDSDSAVEMCMDKIPKTQLDFVVNSLNEQYFAMSFICAHPLSSVYAVIDNTRYLAGALTTWRLTVTDLANFISSKFALALYEAWKLAISQPGLARFKLRLGFV